MDDSKGLLLKRKDFLGVDEEAGTHPNRTYYYKKDSNIDSILESCTKELQIHPHNKNALALRGTTFQKKHMHEEAINDFSTLLEIDPQNVDILQSRGISYTKMGMHDVAIHDFSNVLRIFPNHINAAFARAACYNAIGQFSRAIEDYNFALVKDQDSARVEKYDRRRANSLSSTRESAQSISSAYNANPDYLSDSNPASMSAQIVHSVESGRSSTSQIRNYFDAEFSVKASPKSSSIATPVRSSSAPPRNSNRREVDSSPQSSDVSDIILGRGLEFRKQGNFESAIKEYTKVLARNPRHFKAFFNRAFALDKLGKYEQAIEDYSAAIDLDNSNPYVIFNRGILYDKTGNLIDAEKDFHAAVFLQNQNPEFLFNLAFCLKRLGRFNDAISVYTKCIRIQPNNLKAICSKGDCFEKIGCPDMALKEYNHALSKLPQYVPALCGRAKIFADRAGTDNSQAAYRDYSVALSVAQLSEFKGDLPEIFMQRAKVQEAMGNMELAISDLNSGISLLLTNIAKSSQSSHSNHMLRIRTSELLVYRLQLFKGLENFSKAKDDCTEVITLLSPIDGTSRSDGISCTLCDSERKKIIDLITTVLLGRGQCFRKANCIQQAINDYSEMIRFDSHNIKAFNNRAYCYAKLLQYEKAISDYTAVISLDPLNSHAFHNRGISFDKLGDKESALADFAKVFHLDSSSNVEHERVTMTSPHKESHSSDKRVAGRNDLYASREFSNRSILDFSGQNNAPVESSSLTKSKDNVKLIGEAGLKHYASPTTPNNNFSKKEINNFSPARQIKVTSAQKSINLTSLNPQSPSVGFHEASRLLGGKLTHVELKKSDPKLRSPKYSNGKQYTVDIHRNR